MAAKKKPNPRQNVMRNDGTTYIRTPKKAGMRVVTSSPMPKGAAYPVGTSVTRRAKKPGEWTEPQVVTKGQSAAGKRAAGAAKAAKKAANAPKRKTGTAKSKGFAYGRKTV